MVEGGKGLSTVPKIALVGCGYWGKNLCRNFHALGALSAVVDAYRKWAINRPFHCSHDALYQITLKTFSETNKSKGLHWLPLLKPMPNLLFKQCVLVKMCLWKNPWHCRLVMQNYATSGVENNRILMVGHLLEYHPAVLKLRELIDSGELGKINYIYSNRLNFGKVRTEENALWSFAPHDVAVILRLLGQSPIAVSASGGAYLTKDIADVTVSNLRFSDNSRAHIFVSWLHPYKEQRLVVVGDKKMAIFNDVAPYR